MRSFIKTSTSIVLAAALASATLAPTSASAQWRHAGGMHGMHGGWGGPVAFGLLGLATGLALSAAANQNNCVAYRNVYDGAGNYLGQQAFNVC